MLFFLFCIHKIILKKVSQVPKKKKKGIATVSNMDYKSAY